MVPLDDLGTLTRQAAMLRRLCEANTADPRVQGWLSAAQMMEREAEYVQRLTAGDVPDCPASGERVMVEVGDLRRGDSVPWSNPS